MAVLQSKDSSSTISFSTPLIRRSCCQRSCRPPAYIVREINANFVWGWIGPFEVNLKESVDRIAARSRTGFLHSPNTSCCCVRVTGGGLLAEAATVAATVN